MVTLRKTMDTFEAAGMASCKIFASAMLQCAFGCSFDRTCTAKAKFLIVDAFMLRTGDAFVIIPVRMFMHYTVPTVVVGG